MTSPGVRVKICGLVRPEDARLAAGAGADHIGVVHVPGTPRFRSAEEARELGRAAGIPLVLVVAADAHDLAERLLDTALRSGASVLQLHGDESPALVARLRDLAHASGHPLELWKALRVRTGEEILPAARRWAGVVDLLLLDGWHPGQQGGTGTAFPWEALEEVRTRWPSGLGLGAAGGLRPDTVGEAVRRLRPDWVDVSSGVEYRAGEKDPTRMTAFVKAARAAFVEPGP